MNVRRRHETPGAETKDTLIPTVIEIEYQNLHHFSESQFPQGNEKKVLGHERNPKH